MKLSFRVTIITEQLCNAGYLMADELIAQHSDMKSAVQSKFIVDLNGLDVNMHLVNKWHRTWYCSAWMVIIDISYFD